MNKVIQSQDSPPVISRLSLKIDAIVKQINRAWKLKIEATY